jgi:hypothetical protein
VEDLGFQLLDKKDSSVGRQGGKCWFSVHFGEADLLVLPAGVAGYSFPPLSGEPGILTLWQGSRGSPVVRHCGRCWDFLGLREAGLLALKGWQITTQLRSWVPAL